MSKLLRIVLLGVVFLAGCDLLNPDSENADLIDLLITGVELSPAFDPEVTSYTATVDANTEQALIEAVAFHGKATIIINDTQRGSTSASATIQLAVGENTITVVVIAESGDRSRTYTIVITRPSPTYTIGGSVSGLTGTLILLNNGGDDLSLSSDGPFEFATGVDDGSGYNVTVGTQPDGLVCSVGGGSGTVAGADVTSIAVTCVVPTHAVGGSVSGLDGTLVLQNNGGDDLSLTTDGSFAFATPIEEGAAYNVTVGTQPGGQVCSIENGAGTMGTADVTNVNVTCIVPTYSVGGTLSGLTGSVTLQNNSGDDLTLTADGSFTFATGLVSGSAYSVSVSAQPAGQLCTVTNGTGAIAGANVTNVDVSCTDTGGSTSSGWTWANPVPQGNDIEDIVWTGSQFVAVGAYGTIRTSANGLSWTTQDSGISTHIRGVAWDGSKLIAVAIPSKILTSEDGVTWSSVDLGQNTNLNKVIWGGSQFVAVGSGLSGQVLTSPDGINWTARNAATSYVSLRDIAWNGSQYVAVASGSGIYNYVYTSPTGVTWTRQYLGPNNTGRSITTNGNLFVVAADRYVYTSVDGVTWNLPVAGGNENPYGVYASLWDGSQFVLAASNALLTSPDGETWTTTSGLSLGAVLTLATNGSQYLTAGRAGAMNNSPDLSAWTQQTSGPANHLLDVLWTGELFVAVGSNVIMTSPDGTAWTQRDQNTGTWPNSANLHGVAWSGSVFVAVGPSGDLLTSPDGLTWAVGNSGVTATLNAVVWDGGQFVAVGSGNTIITSPDGVTWTPQTSSSTEGTNLTVVGWNGTQFVAAGLVTGGNVVIMTSPDGINWTNESISAAQYAGPEDITWDGSQWLMVLARGLYTSPDGSVWTPQTDGVPDTETYACLAYTGTQYFLAAVTGLILTSADGTTWSGGQHAITGAMQRMVWDGGKLVTVGYQGSILNYSEP